MIYLPEISAIAQSMIPYKTCIVCYKAYLHFFISVSAAGLYATNIIPAKLFFELATIFHGV